MDFAALVAECREDPYDDLRSALQSELVSLWTDLAEAMRSAYDGEWSIGCDDIARRIVYISDLVEPMGWRNCPPELLENGLFLKLNEAMGNELGPHARRWIAEFLADQEARRAAS